MSKDKTTYFVLMQDNKVLIHERFYSRFYGKLKDKFPECKGRDHYKDRFNNRRYFTQWIEGNNLYFQKIN